MLSYFDLQNAMIAMRRWRKNQERSVQRQGLPVTADEEMAYIKKNWPTATFEQQEAIWNA